MPQTALFIGRFQPFHLGHFDVIKKLDKKYDKVIIAVGSSQESNTKKNPFSFEERKKMINDVCIKEGIKCIVRAVPDIPIDDEWVAHLEKHVPWFDVVYTGNPSTKRLLEGKYEVVGVQEVLSISGRRIRAGMCAGDIWKGHVHVITLRYLNKIKGVERVKELFA